MHFSSLPCFPHSPHPIHHLPFSHFNNVWQVQTMKLLPMHFPPASCYFHFKYIDICFCMYVCNCVMIVIIICLLQYGVCRFTNKFIHLNPLRPSHTHTHNFAPTQPTQTRGVRFTNWHQGNCKMKLLCQPSKRNLYDRHSKHNETHDGTFHTGRQRQCS